MTLQIIVVEHRPTPSYIFVYLLHRNFSAANAYEYLPPSLEYIKRSSSPVEGLYLLQFAARADLNGIVSRPLILAVSSYTSVYSSSVSSGRFESRQVEERRVCRRESINRFCCRGVVECADNNVPT